MKRLSLLLVAAMVLTTVVATANPFSDVPFSHWSYDAVNKLAAKGILQGYPDGTFKGNKAVTRYALAMVTAKMVANVEQMLESGVGSNLVTKSDLQTLEKLTVEFADELALLGVKVTALEDDMQVVKEDVSTLRHDVDGIKDYMAKGGMEKVKISGDMLVRHQNATANVGGGTSNRPPWADGVDTYSQLRLTFKANIDENIEAVARWYISNAGNDQIPNTGDQFGSGATTTDNTYDLAYLKVHHMFRNVRGDWTFGRNEYHHGSNLLLSSAGIDAVRYEQAVGDVDMALMYVYDRDNPNNNPGGPRMTPRNPDYNGIWNLNFDTKYRDNDIYLGFYMQHLTSNIPVPTATNKANDGDRFDVELGAKGPLGNNGHYDYELGFVFNKTDAQAVKFNKKTVTPPAPAVAYDKDKEGFMAHVALNWDSKQEWGAKLAYTYANDESQGSVMGLDNNARYCDGIETPFEDVARGNSWFNNGLVNASIIKAQVEYRPREYERHYFRLAGDFISKVDDRDGTDLLTSSISGAPDLAATDICKGKAAVATFEYRYQLTENSRIRVGYTNFDFSGDDNIGGTSFKAGYGRDNFGTGFNSYQMFWAELYAHF